jgi:hypothetical protein
MSNFIARWAMRVTLFSCASLAYTANAVIDLLKSSDVAVIGVPVAFTDRSDGTIINLSIVQWLSPAPSGAAPSAQVLWTAPAAQRQAVTAAGPSKSSAGIWFLNSQGDGTYKLTPVISGKVPLNFYPAADRGSCPGALAYTSEATITDKIALELACAASKESGSPSSFSGSMVEGTYGLGTSARVHDAFMYLAQLSGSRQKAIGYACLIANKDPAGLALLAQHIQELTDYDLQVVVARTILSWHDPDPAATRSIGRIATSPRATGTLLRCACLALREIHTVETLPFLRLLLDSPDRNARLDAIASLIAFVTGLPVHTPENSVTMEFMKPSPTPYSNDSSWRKFPITSDSSDAELQVAVAFWKQWLSAHPELTQ